MNTVAVRLERISIWAHHGMEESEKKDGGPFEIDIVVNYPEPTNATEDSIFGRPDYAEIGALAKEVFLARRFSVIEPLASLIAERIMSRFSGVKGTSVTIRKFKPVMPVTLAHVEVTVSRGKQ